MRIKKADELKWSDVTPKALYVNRRQFLTVAPFLAAAAADALSPDEARAQGGLPKLDAKKSPLSTTEPMTPYKSVTTYNNYYEFGIDKGDPAEYAKSLKTRPWTVTIDGAVKAGGKFAIDDLIKPYQLEERIYRHRCVEAWSIVVPWIGFPLGDLLKKVQPTEKAKFVEFTTLNDASQMPGVRRPVLNWPYTEGLRLDEAMHRLTLLTVGPLRRGAAEPERRAAAPRGAVEVRLQEHQVDRADPSRREPAAHGVERLGAAGVRVLLEREPECRSPAVEPGERAAHRRFLQAEDADVQRLRRSRVDVWRRWI